MDAVAVNSELPLLHRTALRKLRSEGVFRLRGLLLGEGVVRCVDFSRPTTYCGKKMWAFRGQQV